jgi:uncharacterized protein
MLSPDFNFNETVKFDPELIKSVRTLLDLKNIQIVGQCHYDSSLELLHINLNIQGTMVVPCARSLEPVDYPFSSDAEIDYCFNNENSNEDIIVVKGNEIDTTPLVWELIYLDIPMRVVKEGASLPKKGEGWEVKDSVDEEEQKIDPRLASLKNYFKQ